MADAEYQVEGYANPDGSGRGNWSGVRRPSPWRGALRALATLAILALVLDSLAAAPAPLILAPLVPAGYLVGRAIRELVIR